MLFATATDFMMAWALLTGNCVEQDYKNWNTLGVRQALVQICVKNEYMDEREVSYMFSDKDSFQLDVGVLQGRYNDLKDAPKMIDCFRLLSRQQLNDGITFNRAFITYIEEEIVWNQDRRDIYEAVINESQQLFRIWDAARDAQCDFYYITTRRLALVRLKKLLKEWDGNDKDETYDMLKPFPPNVPIWRFRNQ